MAEERNTGIYRKIIEIIFVVLVLLMSALIFIFRKKIGDVGSVGYLGLFVVCFIANSTVLLPAPSIAVAVSCAFIMNPVIVAVVSALGATMGEFIGYFFGHAGCNLSPRIKGVMDKIDTKLSREEIFVFVLAFLPLPFFDVAGIYSGGTKMNPLKFFVACFLGKLIKMLCYTVGIRYLADNGLMEQLVEKYR